MTAPARFYLFVIILGAMTAFAPLSIDMYLPALPAIGVEFGVAVSRIELSLASFFIGMTIGQLVYGPISDRFGRKKPIYVGLVIYAFASAACALAADSDSLILYRFVQAIGGCAGMVLARAMVRDLFNHRESARVFSLLMLVMGLAPILAPLAGSYIMSFTTWRAMFWLMAVLGFVCLAVVALYLPDTHKADKNVSLRRTFHTYADIFRHRSFLGYSVASGFAGSGMFAYITGSPGVFIGYFGMTPQEYAWLFGVNAFGLIMMSQVNGWLMAKTKVQPETVLDAATLVFAFSGLGLIAAGVLDLGLWFMLPPLLFFVSSLGLIYPNMGAGALQHEKKRAGAASALSGTIFFALSTLSAALISLLHRPDSLTMGVVAGTCGVLCCLTYYCNRTAIKKASAAAMAEEAALT